MSLKEKLDIFSPKCTPVDIQGKTYNFYPLSTRMAFELKAIASPLFSAVSTLFTRTDQDVGTVVKDLMSVKDPTKVEARETTISPIDPDLARMRAMDRDKAIGTLIDALSDDRNQMVIAKVIMDSMRDDFERPVTNDDASEFTTSDQVTIDLLVDLLKGVAKANAKVFGPLGERVSKAVGTQIEHLEQTLEQKKEATQTEKEETSEMPG